MKQINCQAVLTHPCERAAVGFAHPVGEVEFSEEVAREE